MPLASVTAGAVIDPTTFGNAVVDELNDRGVKGYAEAVLPQGSIVGTTVDLTSLTVTFTAKAGRWYKVRLQLFVLSTVAADLVTVTLDNGGVQINGATVSVPAGSNAVGISVEDYVQLAAGSRTLKGRIVRAAGTGTVSTAASGVIPAYICVEDVGPV